MGNVSNAGLLEVIKRLRDADDLPQKNLRGIQNSAFKSYFEDLTYVEEMPLIDGGTFSWPIRETGLFLQRLLAESPVLQQMYSEAFEKHHQKPWQLVVAWDEITPGNKLKVDNGRKTMVISVAFFRIVCP